MGGGHPNPGASVQHPVWLLPPVPRLKRQISDGGSLRARSPDPAQLSSLREPGAQGPAGPQAPRAAQTVGARSPRLCPMQTAAAIRSQRRGWGRGSPQPQGLGPARGRAWRGSAALQGTPPACSLGPPARLPARGRVSWRAPGRRPGSASYLTLQVDDHRSADRGLKTAPRTVAP